MKYPHFLSNRLNGLETWESMKGLTYTDPQNMLDTSGYKAIFEPIPFLTKPNDALPISKLYTTLLADLVAHFVFGLLQQHQREPDFSIETRTTWGIFQKHSVPASVAFVDGSCSKPAIPDSATAGFAVVFPHSDLNPEPHISLTNNEGAYFYKGKIPGAQTIERAEGFAILGSLLISKTHLPLTIYTDCQKLVNDIHQFQHKPPRDHEIAKLSNRSILLRILHEIRSRRGETQVAYLQNHVKNGTSPEPSISRHTELRKFSNLADHEAN